MKKKYLVMAGLCLLLVNSLQAGVLDRGVRLSAIYIAGGAPNGNPVTDQLKYQMAVDAEIGIRERYQPVYLVRTYNTSFDTYYNDYYQHNTYESGSNNTWVNVNAEIGTGKLTVCTNSYGSAN